MSGILDVIAQFKSIADREYENYDFQQNMHFDWLNDVQRIFEEYDSMPEQEKRRISKRSFSSQEGDELIINRKLTTIEEDKICELNKAEKAIYTEKKTPSPKKLQSPTRSPVKSPKRSPKNSPKSKKTSENSPQEINSSQIVPQTTPKPSKKLEIPLNSPQAFQTGSNLLNHSNIRFLDDAALLESDSSSSEIQPEESPLQNVDEDDLEDYTSMDGPPVPYTDTNFDELNQTASSFKDQWLKMIHNKKAEAETPKKPFVFAFEREEEEAMPEVYQISDDENGNEFSDDDEIYEKNPIEIHGKTIPNWARGKQLLSQLKKQRHFDPDTIFINFSPTIQLEEIFNQNKAKWQDRSDSGYWDPDKITPEEVTEFKRALGLI